MRMERSRGDRGEVPLQLGKGPVARRVPDLHRGLAAPAVRVGEPDGAFRVREDAERIRPRLRPSVVEAVRREDSIRRKIRGSRAGNEQNASGDERTPREADDPSDHGTRLARY